MASASSADIRTVLRLLVGAGLFAPWRGEGDLVPSEAEILREWRDAAERRALTGYRLRELVQAWLDKPTADTRRWPAPADVLGGRTPSPGVASVVPGCDRCTLDAGYRTVAVHRLDRHDRPTVDVYAVHCDCQRGAHYAQMRALPLPGAEHERRGEAERLADFVARHQGYASTLAVYVDPTPSQMWLSTPADAPSRPVATSSWHRPLERRAPGAR